jgi:hypothetical protein
VVVARGGKEEVRHVQKKKKKWNLLSRGVREI